MTEGNGDVVVVIPGRFDRSPTLGKLAGAFAKARQNFPRIGKNKEAEVFSQRTGKTFKYAYSDLSTILDAIVPPLLDEGLSLFQPTWVDGAHAIAKTLLIHAESDEWMSSDFAVAIVDLMDARSIGSAAAYACRYGLKMVIPSIADEDDDGEAARGGAHEVAQGKSDPACPACGVVGSIMKGNPQYGGGILCWAKRGGCGTKWPEGTPFPPTSAPPLDPDPTSGKKSAAAKKPAPSAAAKESATLTDRAPAEAVAAVVDALVPPIGSEDCETEGCWGPRGHELPHIFEPNDGSAPATEAVLGVAFPGGVHPSAAEEAGAPVIRFKIGNADIETAGMTEAQFRESVLLSTEIDKGPLGKGYARKILGKILGKPAETSTRKELTEEKAVKYLAALKQAVAGSGQGAFAELAP